MAEQQRRSRSDDVQYLTDRQLEQLVEQMPDNDIKDYEDLQSGGWAGRASAQAGRGAQAGTHRQRPGALTRGTPIFHCFAHVWK